MDIKKAFLLTFVGVVAILAVVFGISKYYGEEMAVPVISYLDEEVTTVLNENAVNINTADVDELMELSGIGEKTAQAIIEYREKHGDFDSVDDLLNIEGIGESKLNAIRSNIYLSEDELNLDDEVTNETDVDIKDIWELNSETTTTEITTFTPSFPLDLNNTTVEELMCIKGVGQSTAEKIKAYADKNGFGSVEDLLNVEGIGEKKLDSIREYVCVKANDFIAATAISETEQTTAAETLFTPSFPLDLNDTTVEELMCIKGVGQSTAEKIKAYADENGFGSVEDLLNVEGIGEKKLDSIREYVCVKANDFTTSATVSETTTTAEITSSAEKTDKLINLNTATVEELMELNGIGQSTAEKIVEYAEEVGFNSVDELVNVSGIGEKKLESIRPFVTV